MGLRGPPGREGPRLGAPSPEPRSPLPAEGGPVGVLRRLPGVGGSEDEPSAGTEAPSRMKSLISMKRSLFCRLS